MAINLTSKKILVVENQILTRENIKFMLGSFGAKFIMEAESGIDAMTAMRANRFDIVLCNYDLIDEKTGQQVLDDARYLNLLPVSAIFIMIISKQNKEIALTTIDNTPDDYLIKPFNQQQLSLVIERCIVRKDYVSNIENEIDKGNLYRAIHHCKILLKLNDKTMCLRLLKMHAELAIKVGDIKKANEIYQNILRLKELPWARFGSGIVALYLGDYDQATDTFQKLIEQYPTMLEAYDWLAKTQESMHNYEAALSCLNLAVNLSPMSILRQKKLALLADKTENLAVAKNAYLAVIKLGKKNNIHKLSADYSGLANIYLRRNTPNKALNIIQELNQQFKSDHEARIRVALLETKIFQAKDNQFQAQQAYKRLHLLNDQLNKELPRELRLEMAKTFYLNGNSETCDEILNDLIRANIDDKHFINDIVAICDTILYEKNTETLIQNIKQELADINNKGVSLFREGKIKEARVFFEEAIIKRPDNHTVILNMIKILIHDIKTSEPDPEKITMAQSYINKAIQLGMPHNQISALQVTLDAIQGL